MKTTMQLEEVNKDLCIAKLRNKENWEIWNACIQEQEHAKKI